LTSLGFYALSKILPFKKFCQNLTIGNPVRKFAKGPVRKFCQSLPITYPQTEAKHCAGCASGKENGAAQSASSNGHWKAMREQQFCNELMIGNFNITSLTGEEHELVEETK